MDRLPRFLRWLSIGVAAIAVLTSVFFFQGVGAKQVPDVLPSSWPQIESTPKPKPVHLVLLQVNDVKKRFVGGLFLLKDGNNLAIADIDSNLAVDLRERGQLELRRASHEVTSPELVDALNVAGGLSIDGAIVFQDVGLAALVDGVGGITLTTKVPIRISPRGVLPVVYLPAGTHKVTGDVAANYATISAPINSFERHQRLREVVTALLDRLPKEATEIEQLLSALGQTGRTTIATSDAADFFSQTRGKWSTAQTIELPTITANNSEYKQWQLFDVQLIRNIFKSRYPIMLWDNDAARTNNQFRIFVRGADDDRLKAQDLLKQGATLYVDSGQRVKQAQTSLRATAGIPDSVITELKNALKLPDLQVEPVVSLPTGADMQLDVGEDFHVIHNENGPK